MFQVMEVVSFSCYFHMAYCVMSEGIVAHWLSVSARSQQADTNVRRALNEV
jgi:hypothetical protein